MISKDCISIRRKQIRNITTRLLKEDILVEPHLQQATGETLQSSSLTENEVRFDICVRSLWQTSQMAFFDLSVLKPNAKRFVNQDISKIYELTEKKKRL